VCRADGSLRAKKKKKGMDYNADIPLEHRPAPGFYDTTDEAAKTYSAPIGQSLRALEGKRRQEVEEQEEKNKRRKGDDGKPKNQAAQFVAAREAQIKKLKEQEQVIRRRKLNLPMPQVGERELEEIVKIGQAGESARELAGDADGATGGLLGDYESLNQARMARTPRTSAPERECSFGSADRQRTTSCLKRGICGL
jgi:pre-mRNA-splicing factor CDC5/CEF1